MDSGLLSKISKAVEEAYDANNVVDVTISMNKFAGKVDVMVQTRVRLSPEPPRHPGDLVPARRNG